MWIEFIHVNDMCDVFSKYIYVQNFVQNVAYSITIS
jgi:hypothetical protein